MAQQDEPSLTTLRPRLTVRLTKDDIQEMCRITQGDHNHRFKEELYALTNDTDRRVATNALWLFQHFAKADNEWLYAKHDDLIDHCLATSDATKLRLTLSLLLRQPFEESQVRTDFIDYCLDHLTDARQPYAIRSQCMKLAYLQMRYWPELLDELKRTLELVACNPMSPAIKSAWRQVMAKMK